MTVNRIVTSSVLICLTIVAVLFDWACALFTALLILGGLYEFFSLVEKKGIPIYKYFGTIVGVIIPLSIYFKFELTRNWELLFVTLALLILFLLQFTRRENTQAIFGISTTLFGILYVAWFFSFIIKIRLLEHGAALLALLLLITKAGDIGAYLIGSRWGRHSLISRISARKSIEGAFGGLAFSILAALASKAYLPGLHIFCYRNLFFMGAFFGLLGQLGDLSESLIKRDCQVKDSGKLLPGMGGILDVIDSLLFTAPAFYFYMSTAFK